MDSQLDHLLVGADRSAQAGDWQTALEHLQSAHELKPDHLGIINGLGTCLLQLNKAEDAIPWFEEACAQASDSPEAHSNLGVALVYMGRHTEAEAAFRDAIEKDDEHRPAWKNLAQILLKQPERLGEGVEILAALIKSDPADLESLLLMAGCYEEGGDQPSALELYHHILSLQPGQPAALDALRRLEPRTPTADHNRIANTGHLQKLANLNVPANPADVKQLSIAMYANAGLAAVNRLEPAAEGLRHVGMDVHTATQFDPADLDSHDAFLFHDPVKPSGFLPAIETCINAGKKVYVDLISEPREQHEGDIDNEWPADRIRGLFKSTQIIAPGTALARILEIDYPNVQVLPPCWSDSNPLWEKKPGTRDEVHLGLVSAYTGVENIASITPFLKDLLHKWADARLVLIGEFADLASLGGIPEEKILFLPLGDVDDYPYLLSEIDILLLPGTDNGYGMQAMMEAGIRSIPWISSWKASAEEWEAGGFAVSEQTELGERIHELLSDPDLRASLGATGREKASGCEAHTSHNLWSDQIAFNVEG